MKSTRELVTFDLMAKIRYANIPCFSWSTQAPLAATRGRLPPPSALVRGRLALAGGRCAARSQMFDGVSMEYYDFLRDAGLAALLLHALASRWFRVKASAGFLYPSAAWLLSFAPLQRQLPHYEIALYGGALAAFVLAACYLVDRRSRNKSVNHSKDEQ